MFARYFIELPMSPEQVTLALASQPEEWVPRLAEQANHVGDTLLADVGFGEHVRIARTVALELGEPISMATKTLIPLRWDATGPRGVFPSMEADLEIAPLSADRTQLAMSARYVPPLGAVGRAIDRAMLFRVAEATLKDFLDGVGSALMSPTAGASPSAAV
ncbi:MAG: hypothetical protein WBM72_04775 [Actinomycetota bacterium]